MTSASRTTLRAMVLCLVVNALLLAADLAGGHPRLVFRPQGAREHGRTFEEVRKLYRTDVTFRGIVDKALALDLEKQHPAMLAASWIVSGEDRFADAAIDRLLVAPISSSGSGSYSNIWSHALAYDWLHQHPRFSQEAKARIEAKIIERLGTELAALDDAGMALWHGRNQAANGAMVAALAVGDLPGRQDNLRRATAHYVESLRALQFSEGWPEGASYWIYNRAGPYALAADCVMTALGVESVGGIPIRGVMRKIGFWSLYQFGPNEVFEPYGDSGGSLRLGETGWWELTTDYFARLSKDPSLMAGADYLRNRSPNPYGRRPYNWWAVLSYDPSARPRNGYDPARPELWMRKTLPQSMLFGRDSIGVAFFRGDWGDPDELYATFKAGDLLAHHDHYDVGHFGIQRGGLLAPQTGIYGQGTDGYDGAYRLGYSVQTVSVNSLLILAPGETSADLRSRKKSVWTSLSGGQRVISPTGFSCVDLDDFRRQLQSGRHFERGGITAFESIAGELDYIAADITAAYNSTLWAEPGSEPKVSLVTRQFLYLRRERAFVIYDRVETTNPRFLPKLLLHSLSKPLSRNEKLLAGRNADDGILETFDHTLRSSHQRGTLTQVVVLPRDARALKIGGPNYYGYVEEDGDQADGFDGVNLSAGDPLVPRTTAQLGLWRTEVEPVSPGTSARFLNVLLPRLTAGDAETPEVELVPTGDSADGVRVGNAVVVLARGAKPLDRVDLKLDRSAEVILVDAAPGGRYRSGSRSANASGEGVLRIPGLPRGRHTIEKTIR